MMQNAELIAKALHNAKAYWRVSTGKDEVPLLWDRTERSDRAVEVQAVLDVLEAGIIQDGPELSALKARRNQ